MKIHNKRELKNIAINHLDDSMKIYKKCTSEPYPFFTTDTNLPNNNSLRFRKNLLGSF